MKVMMLAFLVCMLSMASLSSGQASGIDYYVIVEDNGNSVVIVTVEGSGLVSIPIQGDVEGVEVSGALYLMNDTTLELSIGQTEGAVVIYKTSLLTWKQGDTWSFSMDLSGMENVNLTVAMPEDTVVLETSPQAMMESGDFLTLYWEDVEGASVDYRFPADTGDLGDLTEPGEKVSPHQGIFMGLLALAAVIIIVYIGVQRRGSLKRKRDIMKTLPANENKIIEILLENSGEMKRSRLERKSGISKSSLAASLKNLERKNILVVDRTSASHYVKFTEWFNEK